MGINRRMQRCVLESLERVFPNELEYTDIMGEVFDAKQGLKASDDSPRELDYNIQYLVGHGLIHETKIRPAAFGSETHYFFGISSNGIDFLEDDGGLSAVLKTVTVKFDADNLRSLVEEGLLRADLPEDKKSSIRDALRSMPGTTLQAITSKLLEKALDDPMGATKAVAGILGITL